MDSVIFYEIAEYCDFAAKLTIKWQGNQVRTEIWHTGKENIDVKTKDYSSSKSARNAYLIAIGKAVNGGWKILNAVPQRETWETKRSK